MTVKVKLTVTVKGVTMYVRLILNCDSNICSDSVSDSNRRSYVYQTARWTVSVTVTGTIIVGDMYIRMQFCI